MRYSVSYALSDQTLMCYRVHVTGQDKAHQTLMRYRVLCAISSQTLMRYRVWLVESNGVSCGEESEEGGRALGAVASCRLCAE